MASDIYEVVERIPAGDGHALAAAFATASGKADSPEPATPEPATPELATATPEPPALEDAAAEEWDEAAGSASGRAAAGTGPVEVADDSIEEEAELIEEVVDVPLPAMRPRRAATQPPPPPPGRAGDARPTPFTGREGLITQAVAMAAPSAAMAGAGTRVGVGQTAPVPLTELATARLIRPEDGNAAFEIGAGGVLIVRVVERILSRTEEVVVSCGDLSFEPATRRVRGAKSSEPFGADDKHLFIVSGQGYLVAAPAGHTFTAVSLDDDILYLRESLVYAFEQHLRWENGNVPGSSGQMHVVQFRGQGCVAVRSKRPLLSLKLGSDRVVYVEADVLAGWIGRVVPRLVTPAAGGGSSAPFVECSGEGVVLIEDQGGA